MRTIPLGNFILDRDASASIPPAFNSLTSTSLAWIARFVRSVSAAVTFFRSYMGRSFTCTSKPALRGGHAHSVGMFVIIGFQCARLRKSKICDAVRLDSPSSQLCVLTCTIAVTLLICESLSMASPVCTKRRGDITVMTSLSSSTRARASFSARSFAFATAKSLLEARSIASPASLFAMPARSWSFAFAASRMSVALLLPASSIIRPRTTIANQNHPLTSISSSYFSHRSRHLLNLGVTSHRLSHHPRIFLTKFSFESNLRIFSDLFLASLADLIASSQPSRATPIMTKQVPIFATESQVLSEAESKKSMAEYQRHESFRIVLTFWALGALFVLITLRIVVGIMLIMEKKKRAADS